MLTFPNSSAMDATASSGGPITMLPQIVTGQPEQIAKHVLELASQAAKFLSVYNDMTKAAEQLSKIWSGSASDSALKKISDSLDQLTKIIQAVQQGAELLGVSGTLIKTAQEAYRAVVSAVNPTVAALMSNWWTYGAAVALSTATSASLKAFITAIGVLLKALGAVDLAKQISQLGQIIGEIQKLFGHDSGQTGSVPAGGNAGVAGSPVTAPRAPATVASPTGQQAIGGQGGGTPGQAPSFTDYQPPALTGGGAGSGSGSGTWPSSASDPANSWIAVDHPTTGTTPAPAPVPAPVGVGAGQVTITTDLTTGQSTVTAPGGQDLDIDVDLTYNGKHFEQHVDIDAGADAAKGR
ncbi:WXG100 family type VII secretion target [Amycolatopsis sp. H20-H5]|uniref:WXG100 family type VII secretion target n=1 Tax=Amycolatopsis sp. H20-H5 TaxID=3046309 RepID=UPI002DBD522E|nr:hypothetical protein [Amycolatopsis sp. H20-H5]MEC3978331.1 hypothetical protein [Amycolatopsis sp. H20-H5]